MIEISELRSLFVKDTDYDISLFVRMGQMDGLKKIIDSVFENILNDSNLTHYY